MRNLPLHSQKTHSNFPEVQPLSCSLFLALSDRSGNNTMKTTGVRFWFTTVATHMRITGKFKYILIPNIYFSWPRAQLLVIFKSSLGKYNEHSRLRTSAAGEWWFSDKDV